MYTKVAKKWFVPYGIWIYLSHDEAASIASKQSAGEIASAISAIGGVYAAAAAASIYLQLSYLRQKNDASRGRGVRCLFVWATGMVTSIERQ